ncbi:unannotated protein [freshwater metagenome]|uniref:Unannotated protein n=1 Tax=freshwater metagenome TaxID=449393 RepID=A0A6J7NED3_9ZZZZ
MSASTSFAVVAGAVTSSMYVVAVWLLQCSTTALISFSEMNAPWMRIDLFSPIGRKRPSPCPTSFSAPG